MRTLYDIGVHFIVAMLLPYFLVRLVTTRKYRKGIPERFGLLSPEKTRSLAGGPVVWVHAVSVGETKAVLPLLKRLKQRNPGLKIAFSTVTRTGNEVAAKDGTGVIDSLFFLPLDLSWAVKRVVSMVGPSVFVVVEKETWPNLFGVLSRRRTPIVVVNGTMSEKSFRRYKRLGGLFRGVFAQVTRFCARTGEDREKAVGVGVAPDKAETTGNIKFDLAPPEADPGELDGLKSAFAVAPGESVLVAGSTHRGEEKIILAAFSRLGDSPRARLVLAPRHPERFEEVEGLLRNSGISWSKRSRGGGDTDIVLLDTVGELMHAYAFATVALVGGSLVPGIGGHNLLEPAYYGKPVLFGAHLTTYSGMGRMLEDAGGGLSVTDEKDLADKLARLFTDEVTRARMGQKAQEVVEANRGASERTIEIIEGLLKKGLKR